MVDFRRAIVDAWVERETFRYKLWFQDQEPTEEWVTRFTEVADDFSDLFVPLVETLYAKNGLTDIDALEEAWYLFWYRKKEDSYIEKRNQARDAASWINRHIKRS